ncbi:MAG: histidine phosphatase family protein [Chromatium okenii]|nr:histidine phosphatase family protein [Chromatium okenii]
MTAPRFVDLLRHGTVSGGARLRGSCDDPLTSDGWAQMARATADAPAWSLIISSPAQRCAAFARQLAAQHQIPLRFDSALAEWHFGAWDGLPFAQLPADQLLRLWTNPADFAPPAAEPFAAFQTRVLTAWQTVQQSNEPHSLLITHGVVIRVLIAEVLQMPVTALALLEVPPANLSRLCLYPAPGQPSLLFHRS